MSWRRKLWAVELTTPHDKTLIGALWAIDADRTEAYYDGEPTRALLFTSRRLARHWCANEMASYRDYSDGHPCRSWKFRPVRVTETVKVAK